MTTPPDYITPPEFGIAVRGYDRTQVDAYFGRVVEWLADAENRALAAERARESLAREVTELRTTVTMLEEKAGLPGPQSMSAFSERMGQVMESALEAAHELRAEAERECRERKEASESQASQLVDAARERAEEIVEGARRAQQAMEESLEQLRRSRSHAIESLLDLQRRIASVASGPEPSLDGDAEARLDEGQVVRDDSGQTALDGKWHEDQDDVTMSIPALATSEQAGAFGAMRNEEGPGDPVSLTARGVLVTATPTVIQPAVGTAEGGTEETGSSPTRRSA